MILLEATVLGLFGGFIGNLISWGFSRLVNFAAAEYLEGIPFRPDEFFVYDWRVILGGVVFAWFFCLPGAFWFWRIEDDAVVTLRKGLSSDAAGAGYELLRLVHHVRGL